MNRKRRQIRKTSLIDYHPLECRRLLATIAVTTFDDIVDPNDGKTSIREAVDIANFNGEDDVIVLSAVNYRLTIEGAGEDANETGDLDVQNDGGHSISIIGAGMDATSINANGIDRIIEAHIESVLRLEGLTVKNGTPDLGESPPTGGHRGGAIKSAHSILEMVDVGLRGNHIEDGDGAGGGVYIAGGSFNILGSEFVANSAIRGGSAIQVRASSGQIKLTNFLENEESAVIGAIDGDLNIRQSKIDFNDRGISLEGGSLDLFHTRFLGNPLGLFTRDSSVTADDVRWTDSGEFQFDPQSDLSLTNSFISSSTIFFRGDSVGLQSNEFQGDSRVRIWRNSQLAGTIEINDIQFESSGQIFVQNDGGPVTISNVSITEVGQFDDSRALVVRGEDVVLRNIDIHDRLQSGIWINARNSASVINSVIMNTESGLTIIGRDARVMNSRIVGTNSDREDQFGGPGVVFLPLTSDAQLVISNSLIAKNVNDNEGIGAAIQVLNLPSLDQVHVLILSSTIAHNASEQGAVIFSQVENTTLEMHNSILSGNSSPIAFGGIAHFNVTHSLIPDEDPGAGDVPFGAEYGNRDELPMFLNVAENDYRLQSTSSAIDGGDSERLLLDDFDVDDDGNTTEFAPDLDLMDRVFGAETDMGALEFFSV